MIHMDGYCGHVVARLFGRGFIKKSSYLGRSGTEIEAVGNFSVLT
jgi:hypothetical protein